MAQQTLLRPPQQAAQHKQPRTAQARVEAKGPVSHRKPEARSTARSERRDRLWAAASLVVMFVLSLVCGVLLAVHGPSDSSSLEVRPTPTPARSSAVQSDPAPRRRRTMQTSTRHVTHQSTTE